MNKDFLYQIKSLDISQQTPGTETGVGFFPYIYL